MIPYFNPGGRNWGGFNFDGYAMTYIAFAVIYSFFFYLACGYVWYHRDYPVIKMRKIGLSLLSVLILHFYLVAILLLYPLNGCFPCSAEYWIMSLYLPLGTALFQAQNQQLLLISRKQNRLLRTEEFKPLYHARSKAAGTGIGTPRYWLWRVKLWWQEVSAEGKYEGYVFVGMILQVIASIIIFCISRQFTSFGIVSHYTTPAQCRNGWEWAPSIIWQFLWNYLFGPYLLWKIHVIRDIYQWRLQTTLTIIAGLPGVPLWVAAVYSDSFKPVNKWLAPAIWFAPGLITMEITVLFFNIMHIVRKKQHDKAVDYCIEDYLRKTGRKSLSITSSSRSLNSPAPGTSSYSLEALNLCIRTDCEGLLHFATHREFNGENIIFLMKVVSFQEQYNSCFLSAPTYGGYSGALSNMFRVGLSIYIHLVHPATAQFPINVESPVLTQLKAMFGAAADMVASSRRSSTTLTAVSSEIAPWETQTMTGISSEIAPWETQTVTGISSEIAPWGTQAPAGSHDNGTDTFHLLSMSRSFNSATTACTDRILSSLDRQEFIDPLARFIVPSDFDETIFDKAYASIAHMVWSSTWKHYIRETEQAPGEFTHHPPTTSSSSSA